MEVFVVGSRSTLTNVVGRKISFIDDVGVQIKAHGCGEREGERDLLVVIGAVGAVDTQSSWAFLCCGGEQQ